MMPRGSSSYARLFTQFILGLALVSSLSFEVRAGRKGATPRVSCAQFLASKPELTPEQRKSLELIGRRYRKADPSKVIFTPNAQYPLLIHGLSEKSFAKLPSLETAIVDPEFNDVLVMGGGPAGGYAAVRLTDKNLKVRLLEREDVLGGLGRGADDEDDVQSGVGSAYSSGPEGQLEHAIYRSIGLRNLKKKHRIASPIDSFLWNGKLYEGFWEDNSVLRSLPTSFELFKHVLEWSRKNLISAIDEPHGQALDALNAEQWIKQMPQVLSMMKDKYSKDLYSRFKTDPRIDRTDPMKSVIELMDLYCRSALGMPPSFISALAFADFYISELDTRYTGTLGTGTITEAIFKTLKQDHRQFEATTGATVVKVQNCEDFVEVFYLKDGKLHKTRSKYFVYSGPVKLAPTIIENFDQLAPERKALIDRIEMTDYLVHVLRLKGHPYRAAFDLWARDQKYNSVWLPTGNGPLPDPTDFILGRWVDPKIAGYKGMQDFQKNPDDDRGILTLYHPLGTYSAGKPLSREQVTALAEHAVNRTREMLDPVLREKWGTHLEIELVETYVWRNSIHVVRPGFLLNAQTISKPIGRIHFANNTLRTPEIEDAMKQGRYAADEIVDRNKLDRANSPRK